MKSLPCDETLKLAEALMSMVNQYFIHHSDGTISHSFMSVEEEAIRVLVRLGLAAEMGRERYKLLWENLNLRG